MTELERSESDANRSLTTHAINLTVVVTQLAVGGVQQDDLGETVPGDLLVRVAVLAGRRPPS
ncbi:MAG TPA: hypothetical protein VFV01_20000 [Spirillospora sp.]|nr:hypothetical protein [Spirillospora sp.]